MLKHGQPRGSAINLQTGPWSSAGNCTLDKIISHLNIAGTYLAEYSPAEKDQGVTMDTKLNIKQQVVKPLN